MGLLFEEIDSQPSNLGEISLRRRRIPAIGDRDIYEVKLGDEFLMSSLFVDAEIALSDIGLSAVGGNALQVVVGGLGLGYTAHAALRNNSVHELIVVEALDTVINWHREGLIPSGKELSGDSRCRFVHADFFELATKAEGGFFEQFGFNKTESPQAVSYPCVDAILLDIDHSPSAYLNNSNASFYSVENLSLMKEQIRPKGVFAMWSNEPPDEDFLSLLNQIFEQANSHIISFYNPLQNGESTNTVYVATNH